MVIFLLNEDRAYLSWLAHHRNGFVLDWLRQPTRKVPVLHRANCPAIKKSDSKRTHWTTGKHIKVCSLDLDEIITWAHDDSGRAPEDCPECQPRAAVTPAEVTADRHLTKLGKEIVDYVVEVAMIHLDHQDTDYHTTVDDVAHCLDKSIKQIAAALLRLVADGYLRLDPAATDEDSLAPQTSVLPTADAFRTLPNYRKLGDDEIEAEIQSLTEEEPE